MNLDDLDLLMKPSSDSFRFNLYIFSCYCMFLILKEILPSEKAVFLAVSTFLPLKYNVVLPNEVQGKV